MVSAYWLPIKTAAALFPLLGLILLLPTAVVLYRRHGVMSRRRALSLAGFAYFLFTAFCLTLVPLPRRTAHMCAQFTLVAHPEWHPGHTFGDIWKEAHHKATIGALVIHNPAVAGAVFNLLLLLPLGVFVRYHLRRGVAFTLLVGFGTALFFETTQGTGLWWIYPCPFRLFDVDDLLTNAAGTALGWLVAAPLARALPELELLDDRALTRRPVPFGRRLTALLVDITGCGIAAGVTYLFLGYGTGERPGPGGPSLICLLWFIVLPCLTRATPGKLLLRLRLTGRGGAAFPRLRVALRQAVFLMALAPPLAVLPQVLPLLTEVSSPSAQEHLETARRLGGPQTAYYVFGTAGLVGALLAALVPVLYAVFASRHRHQLAVHELLSDVRNTALPPTRATAAPADPSEEATAVLPAGHP